MAKKKREIIDKRSSQVDPSGINKKLGNLVESTFKKVRKASKKRRAK